MPIKKAYGGRLDAGSVGPRKVNSNPATPLACQPIPLGRFFRNGRHPDANAMNMMGQAATQAALFRSKCIFNGASRMDASAIISSAGAGDRERWRFAFRTSPFTHALYVVAIMGAPTQNHASNTYTRLDVFSDTAEATVVATYNLTYGAGPTGTTTANGFPYLKTITGYLDGLTVDTDYYAAFTDVDSGRILSAMVCELPSLSENNSGYPAMNLCALTPVVDTFRENLATLTESLWKKAGATVLTWSVNDGTAPVTRTSATPANVLDTSVTTVSAASPGWTADLSYCDRLSQSTGVPCQVRVFGKWTKNASPSAAGGTVLIKNSTGTTLGSITDGWSSATPVWVSTTATIPATSDKIDIQINSDAGNGEFAVYAVSIWQQD
jgi:hypothetical protein